MPNPRRNRPNAPTPRRDIESPPTQSPPEWRQWRREYEAERDRQLRRAEQREAERLEVERIAREQQALLEVAQRLPPPEVGQYQSFAWTSTSTSADWQVMPGTIPDPPQYQIDAIDEIQEQHRQRTERDEAILNLRDEIEQLNHRIDEAEADGEDVDDLVSDRNRLRRRLQLLVHERDGLLPARGITNYRQSFADFPINNQKTQIGLARNSESTLRFHLNVQTNRGTYRRSVVTITAGSRGLQLSRVPIRPEMAHGFKVAYRGSDGAHVIVERKSETLDEGS